MARTSVSSKHTACPSWVAIITRSCPLVSVTEISWSPSSSVRARIPLFRRFFSALTSRRFTVPFRVVMNRYSCSSAVSRKWSMACTRSPVSTCKMLTMFMPLAVLPLSGIWYPFLR